MLTGTNYLLGNLLSNHNVTFFIPPYQRNYEWDKEQCEVFYNDIMNTYTSNLNSTVNEHFFGSVTYFATESGFGRPARLVLIDGQQRITTTMLFLVALRDCLKNQNLKDFINTNYLKNEKQTDDSEYKIKLKQVETDWQVFCDIILEKKVDKKEEDSAVYRNYKYFYNELKAVDDDQKLSYIIEKGLDKFRVVTIELEPNKNRWENPQEIFESMNSLGKVLSLADLVRNYLLLGFNATDQERLYKNYWLSMEKRIPGRLSDFIRDYMQLRAEKSYKKSTPTNYKELYYYFKNVTIKSFDDCKENLLRTLDEYSVYYSYIIGLAKYPDNTIDSLFSDFRRINLTTAYSFFMGLLRAKDDKKFSTEDVVSILNTFRTYVLRRRLADEHIGENKVFATFSKYIESLVGETNKTQKLFQILASQDKSLRLPNDYELQTKISEMNFYNFSLCKYLLSLIEESITKSRPVYDSVQIEHIMPQTLSDPWKISLGHNCMSIYEEFINNIGNLTLLRFNSEAGNKDFHSKKSIYENQEGLQISRQKIIDCEMWNAETIKARRDWIVKYLLDEVLKVPDEMKKSNNYLSERKNFSFSAIGLIGKEIYFFEDPSFTARVLDDTKVLFENKSYKLSPLTREIKTRKGTVSLSGAYQGSKYWAYDGKLLDDLLSEALYSDDDE